MTSPVTRAEPGVVRQAAVRAAVTILAVAAVATLLIPGLTQEFWYGLAWVGFPIVGALVLWRRPANVIGWLLLLTGSCWAVALAGYSLVGEPPGRGPVWVELVGQICGYLGWVLLIAMIVLFPTGRTQTRATRWLIRATALTGVLVVAFALVNPAPLEASQRRNPLGVTEVAGLAGWFIDQGFVIVPLLMLGALVSLASRWRHSVGAERLQYRWFVLSVGLALVAVVASVAFGERVGLLEILQTVLFSLGLNAIPVAIGIAVTRYRLYEIDRVVSRTASYIVVTGVLLAVYAVTVTAVSRLLPGPRAPSPWPRRRSLPRRALPAGADPGAGRRRPSVQPVAVRRAAHGRRPSPGGCATKSSPTKCPLTCWASSSAPSSRTASPFG